MFKELLLKDIKMLLQYKQIIIISIIFPLLILGLLGFIFSDYMSHNEIINKIEIALINNDDSQASKMLINDFKNNKSFAKLFQLTIYDMEEAKEKYLKGDVTAILEIPEDFSKSLISYENKPLNLTINPENPLESLILRNVMESYSKYISAADISVYTLYQQIKDIGLSREEINRINDVFSIHMILTALERDNLFKYNPITTIPSTSSFEYFIIATGVLLAMYVGLIGANMIFYEKRTMCLDRYKLSVDGNLIALMMSKIIVLLVFTLCQILLLILPVVLVFGIDTDFSILNFILFLIISLFNIISISIFLGSIVSSEELIAMIGNVGILISGLIGGSFIPLKLMPQYIQKISQITPNYWIIKGFLFITKGFELQDIVLNIIVLLGTSIIFITLSRYRLKQRG